MGKSTRFGQRDVIRGSWSDLQRRDPSGQQSGGARATASVAGSEEPGDERKNHGGFLTVLLVIGVGLLCSTGLGSLQSSTQPYPDGQIVHGTVFSVNHGYKTFKGRRISDCTVQVGFTLEGKARRARSSYATTDQCAMQGQQVDVAVRGSDPTRARVLITSAEPALKFGQFFVWFWVAMAAWILLHRRRTIAPRRAPSSA